MCKNYFVILFFLIISFVLHAQLPEPSGRRLRTIVEDIYPDSNIIIGGTTGSWAFGTNTGLILDREFSYVTPENDFKQSNIHPYPTAWGWTQSDAWVQHIVDNNQILRMHCSIGPQCSAWAKDDIRTAEELETNLREFLQAVCERYNGASGIEYMDVVNETVIQGYWHTDKPGTDWECPWYKIGLDNDANETPLYIKMAFEVAQQYAPNIKFIYNQHEGNLDSWELIKETVIYLRNSGLRVDGIGWQAHVDNGFATPENLNELRNLIDWAHDNDLEFHITEASVWLKNGCSQVYLEEQAATYRAILEVLLEKRFTGKVAWNIWHIDDDHGWHTEWYPSLFDADYLAKPAYYAVQEALENSTVVIDEYFNKETMTILPNPTTGTFKIKGKDIQSIEIINTKGQIVYSSDDFKSSDEYQVDLSDQPKGMYLVKIKSDDFISVKKIFFTKSVYHPSEQL